MSWREPLSHPIWKVRSKELMLALGKYERSTMSMLRLGHELGWSYDQTRQVLAAAEGSLLFERKGFWRGQPGAERVFDKLIPEHRPGAGRPRKSPTDTFDVDRICFESITCPCGGKTFQRVRGGYTCIGCRSHYPSWSALVRLEPVSAATCAENAD